MRGARLACSGLMLMGVCWLLPGCQHPRRAARMTITWADFNIYGRPALFVDRKYQHSPYPQHTLHYRWLHNAPDEHAHAHGYYSDGASLLSANSLPGSPTSADLRPLPDGPQAPQSIPPTESWEQAPVPDAATVPPAPSARPHEGNPSERLRRRNLHKSERQDLPLSAGPTARLDSAESAVSTPGLIATASHLRESTPVEHAAGIEPPRYADPRQAGPAKLPGTKVLFARP